MGVPFEVAEESLFDAVKELFAKDFLEGCPVGYGTQQAWFLNSIDIDSTGAGAFSAGGDSGSAIVKTATNEVVGVLYAGNGTQTYACPVGLVFSALGCALA